MSHKELSWNQEGTKLFAQGWTVENPKSVPVSYTHLDVYKRQVLRSEILANSLIAMPK